MILRVITQPRAEPITVDEAKKHLRVDIDDDDDYIASLITVARTVCELEARRAFVTQTLELSLEMWPGDERLSMRPGLLYPQMMRSTLQIWPRLGLPIEVPRPPLQSVVSLTYVDYTGTTQTMPPSDYVVDAASEPGRVLLGYNKTWPSAVLQPGPAIKLRYVAGYGDMAVQVPDIYKHAIRLLVGHFYENREEVVVQAGVSAVRLPMAVESLLLLDRGWEG